MGEAGAEEAEGVVGFGAKEEDGDFAGSCGFRDARWGHGESGVFVGYYVGHVDVFLEVEGHQAGVDGAEEDDRYGWEEGDDSWVDEEDGALRNGTEQDP